MFQMNHDAVDFFSVDFTSACTIVAREEYPLGYFAAQAMEVSGRLDGDIDAAAKEFAAEAQMFFAARDPSSAGIANDAYGRLRALLRELPLYNILLPRSDTMLSCFSSASEYQAMWDEMSRGLGDVYKRQPIGSRGYAGSARTCTSSGATPTGCCQRILIS